MKTIQISEETRIPGTNLILEAKDKILFKESNSISSYLEEFKNSYRTIIGIDRESITKIDYNVIKEFMESIPFPITSMEIEKENGSVRWNSKTKEALFYAYGDSISWKIGYIPFYSEYRYISSKNLDFMKSSMNDLEEVIRFLGLNRVAKAMEPLFKRELKLKFTGVVGNFNPYRYLIYCVKTKDPKNFLKKLSKKPDISTWIKMIRPFFDYSYRAPAFMKSLDEILKLCFSPIEDLVFGREISKEWLESIGVSLGGHSEKPIADPLQSKALKSFANKLSATPEGIVSDLEEYMKDTKNRVRRQRSISEAVYEFLAEFVEYVYEEDLMDYYDPYYGFPGKILYFEVIQPIEIKVFGEATY